VHRDAVLGPSVDDGVGYRAAAPVERKGREVQVDDAVLRDVDDPFEYLRMEDAEPDVDVERGELLTEGLAVYPLGHEEWQAGVPGRFRYRTVPVVAVIVRSCNDSGDLEVALPGALDEVLEAPHSKVLGADVQYPLHRASNRGISI